MNSNTLNLDLAPEFWSNLDPIALNLVMDPQFLPNFSFREKRAFNLSSIYLCESGSAPVFRIRIRIYRVAEYGFHLDPDPQHCFRIRGRILYEHYWTLYIVDEFKYSSD